MANMGEVNEASTAYFTVSFYDKYGELADPSAISYRIDCLTNGQEVLDDTVVGSPSSTIEITISPTDSAIINPANEVEEREVSIIASGGGIVQVQDKVQFTVRNLRFK